MKLKFDANQDYQLAAVRAVTDLFEGLPLRADDFSVVKAAERSGLFEGIHEEVVAFGNHTTLNEDQILQNLQRVQVREKIKVATELARSENGQFSQFSVEMETGTGKTYVYLRSILELHTLYGYSKFVVVVPGKAIREGTLKNLEVTESHFRTIYGNIPFEYAVYDSKNMSIVRNFATSKNLQILVINIEAFSKDFDAEDFDIEKGVLFHRPSEKLSGRSPRELVQATHPIVIIDEPQSVDTTEQRRRSIELLNPLFTLRYSATHRNPYNLVYRLDPVQAYAMRLVKKIAVASVRDEQNANDAYIKLLKVDNKRGIKAQIELDVQTKTGPVRKKIWVSNTGDTLADLYFLTGERAEYRQGFQVSEIRAEPGNELIRFEPSGIELHVGEANGGNEELLKRTQIRKTIEEHFEKELQLRDKGIKVLSLFFLDRVANYRLYPEEGTATKGIYAQWFEEEYERLKVMDKYKVLAHPPVGKVHDGYFAEDKSGHLKDSRGEGETADDESAYNKIMREKEKLLSISEPLKFIFSHSALREGWDNPNVFQICTLSQGVSEIKKRQEIGRGLRLPVRQEGDDFVRVFDNSINKLVVIANETYRDFATKLQTEYEQDCGVTFGKVVENMLEGLEYSDADGVSQKLTLEQSKEILEAFKAQGMIDETGKLTELFNPSSSEFSLVLPEAYQSLFGSIIDQVSEYRIEKHIVEHKQPEKIKLNKRIYPDEADFKILWEKIRAHTTYRVQYDTEKLIEKVLEGLAEMPEIQAPRVRYVKADFSVDERGVTAAEVRNQRIDTTQNFALPDILTYIQQATKLRRATIASILTQTKRLDEFKRNPQRFMDEVVERIRTVLSKIVLEGIVYEKSSDGYEMHLFEEKELSAYLEDLVFTKKSVYDAVPVDSMIERNFAEALNEKEQVKLFVKLPRWFTVDTPVGEYNPDWAIVKEEDKKIYFVRETKGTLNFEKLRNAEAMKIRYARKHFAAIGMDDYEAVVDASDI